VTLLEAHPGPPGESGSEQSRLLLNRSSAGAKFGRGLLRLLVLSDLRLLFVARLQPVEVGRGSACATAGTVHKISTQPTNVPQQTRLGPTCARPPLAQFYDHNRRKARIGSTRAARRAGQMPAKTLTQWQIGSLRPTTRREKRTRPPLGGALAAGVGVDDDPQYPGTPRPTPGRPDRPTAEHSRLGEEEHQNIAVGRPTVLQMPISWWRSRMVIRSVLTIPRRPRPRPPCHRSQKDLQEDEKRPHLLEVAEHRLGLKPMPLIRSSTTARSAGSPTRTITLP